MTETIALRQEVHAFIDTLTERSLYALKPLLNVLSDNEPLIIETDLTDEEHELIADTVKEYHEHPENFMSWKDVKRLKGKA